PRPSPQHLSCPTRRSSDLKPEAELRVLDRIIETQVEEGLPVLENFDRTITEVEQMPPEDIEKEAMAMAEGEASGVIGTIKALPRDRKSTRLNSSHVKISYA